MDKPVEQFKPIFPPFEQPKRILPFPAMTIGGYIVLAVALMVTGHVAGYSDDTMNRLLEHIGARSFVLFWGLLLVSIQLRSSLFAGMSRTSMNKNHFIGGFLMSAVLSVVGMVLMAQHRHALMQSWCFDFVAWMISFSMVYEYQFIVAHPKQDS